MGKEDTDKLKKKASDNDESEETEDPTRGRLDERTIAYFKRVQDVIAENNFQGDEDRELFLNNVLREVLNDNFVQLCRHNTTSEVISGIAAVASNIQLSKLISAIIEAGQVLFCDRFGSHLIEGIIKCIIQYGEVLSDAEDLCTLWESFKKLCTLVCDNTADMIRDTYSCHILSSLIQVMGGRIVEESITRSKLSRSNRSNRGKQSPNTGESNFKVSSQMKKLLRKQCKSILEDDNFGELLCNTNSSPVVQTLLIVLEKEKKKSFKILCQQTLSKLKLETGLSDDKKLPVMLVDPIGSHLVEVLLKVSDDETFTMLYKQIFSKRLLMFSLHPIANFVLQAMISHVSNPELAQEIFDEITEFLEDIFASGHMGIIVQLSKCALKFPKAQKTLMKALMSALHVSKENADVCLGKLILSLTTYDVLFKDDESEEDQNAVALSKETVTYHGACILKEIFYFKKSKLITNSMLALTADELNMLMRHEYGSFVLESLIKALGEKPKNLEKLVKLCQKDIIALACNKFGSHVLDTLFASADETQRSLLKESLTINAISVKRDFFGKHVLRNFGIDVNNLNNSLPISNKRKQGMEPSVESKKSKANR